MIVSLSGADRTSATELFARLFRTRREFFIEVRGWSMPTRSGLDIDRYDTPNAKYFFELDEKTNEVLSHVRLNPADTESLLNDSFPHLVATTLPDSGRVMEATRFLVSPKMRGAERRRRAQAELAFAMFNWALMNNVTHIQGVLETALLPDFLEMAPQTVPLGLSTPYGGGPGVRGGGEAIAMLSPVNRKTLREVSEFGGFDANCCEACVNGCGSQAA